ncbi:DUF2530 domain-containing protein [Cellulomonas fengjieae]|uniref:DUF2530 domain-containing protein n=1 Tax=Cellulomonas fengjieae TaxID=2819978 RepID=A0ABS3SGU0_9CELL|nr:DUF2530 domain-containing protein [Cellulomonas fengjieae]MBO3084954.1 DUF2530 domain-containing protein [Cellulomonas fengjieae]QVI66446.1 DUF2530 domain-containing protein [Cellulomonas fengjieae]
MPSSLSSLWKPTRSAPPPVAIDLARVLVAGTAVWGLALVVTAALAAMGEVPWDAAWVCATGAVLGLLGLRWARKHPDPAAQAPASTPTPTPKV